MGQVRLVHQSDMPGAVKGTQCSLPAVRQPGASVWEHRKCALGFRFSEGRSKFKQKD